MLATLHKTKCMKCVYFFNKIYAGSLELTLAFSLVILLRTVICILDLNSFATDAVHFPQCLTYATNIIIYNNFQENISHLYPFETVSCYTFPFLVLVRKAQKHTPFLLPWLEKLQLYFFPLLSIFIDHLNMTYTIYKVN